MGLWKACFTCPRLRLPCRQNVWHVVWNGGHLCLPIKKINNKHDFSFFPFFILHIRKGGLKMEVNGNIKVSWWKLSPPTPPSSYHPFFIRGSTFWIWDKALGIKIGLMKWKVSPKRVGSLTKGGGGGGSTTFFPFSLSWYWRLFDADWNRKLFCSNKSSITGVKIMASQQTWPPKFYFLSIQFSVSIEMTSHFFS